MFGTIRKHQTWLWGVIITLTVISFVVYFSPYSKMNNGGGRAGNFGTINGETVTQQQYANAYREVNLHFFLTSGHWLNEDRKRSESDVQREVYNWLLLTQKQEQLGIHVSDEAAAEMARHMVRPFERMGITSPTVFIEKVLPQQQLDVSDFERYLRHFVGIQELISTFGLSGRLITPQEAKTLYEREHQEMATAGVFFTASNYMAAVTAPPEAVAQFYSNRVATYMIPDRVQVSYVKFPSTNFLSQAETELGTNLNELVEA
ncbi:MAG: SurA N-terminal domain-containing protein, partial [Limisphaerales bacterium]